MPSTAPKTCAERRRAHYWRDRRGAITISDIEVSARSLAWMQDIGLVVLTSADDRTARKAAVRQAVERILNSERLPVLLAREGLDDAA